MRRRLGFCLIAVAAACSAAVDDSELSFEGAGLLIVSVDTLRADRLGCYGYGRGTTPHLDALAEESVQFMDMYSNSPKTASSHMSLFTSLLPTVHKVRNQSARLGLELTTLPLNRLTIAQVLNRNGYWNACVAGGGNMNPDMGFGRGFKNRFESALYDVRRLVNKTLDRLDEAADADQPPFVFLHTYQVHGPYLPPPEYEQRFAPDPRTVVGARVDLYRDLPFSQQWRVMNKGPDGDDTKAYWYGKEEFGPEEASYLSDLYDGEIAYTDAQLGRLLDTLRERDVLDDMIVVVLSDHGEEFFEHGDFEHDQLYSEHLHVPCLVRLPGGRLGGTRVEGLSSLIDVMPTLLDLLGIDGPVTMQGVSLVSAMMSGRTPDLPVVAERVMFPNDYKAVMRTAHSTVMFHAKEGRIEAFDLDADPGERSDVSATASFASAAAGALRRSLAAAFNNRDVLDLVDAGTTIQVSADLLEELTALGYVATADQDLTVSEGTPLANWPEND